MWNGLCGIFHVYILRQSIFMAVALFSTAESVFAPLPTTKRGMPLVLHGDPKGKTFLYTVGHSVVIRDIEVSCPVW